MPFDIKYFAVPEVAYIENPRISFYKIKINHDDLYMCELIVDSNNIYS